MGSKGPAGRGQKRAAKIKARQRRQQSSPASTTPVFPSGLLETFEHWLTDREMGRHADRVVGLVRTTLNQVAKANSEFDVTSWTPNDAHFIVDAAERIEESDAENGPAAATNIVVTLLEFLAFLDETDEWTGSDEDFSHCMEDLTDFVYNDPDVLDPSDIELPHVSDEDQAAALAALPLIAGIDTLVAEVGSGQALSHIEALERALSPGQTEVAAADLTVLDQWAAALGARILDTDGDRVVPGSEAHNFTRRSPEILRDALTANIYHQLTVTEVDTSMSLANTFAIQTLLAAMTDDLPLDNEEENYDGLEDEDLRTAQLIDYRIRSLREQGILRRVEDALEVPLALRPAVLAGVSEAEPFAADDHDHDQDDHDHDDTSRVL